MATAAGKFAINLAGGGVVWATEDPNLGQPELSVSAPSLVGFDGERIAKPVRFYVRGNYPAFIKRYEISLYRSSDGDLIEPIATVPVDVAAVAKAEWDGALPGEYRFRAGDELVYVLRAYDGNGVFDETQPRTIQLVRPDEVARAGRQLRDAAEGSLGKAMTLEEATERSLLDAAFAGNGLRQQNIPIYGSRIRIQGRNVPQQTTLSINGEPYPVDAERKFVAEYLVPVGQHAFEIGAEGEGINSERKTLNVEVTGKYFFGVGLADVTIAQNDISRSVEPFAVNGRYADDVISDGRLAFYGKAKLRGKYLITAQADTTEKDLEHLFDGFSRAYPQDIFRRLDPDLYYPVYGDDSTTYRDVDTMGRFYLRADWDKNQALWGNYFTGLTGNEFAQYSRSLYGAALNWRSRAINPWGEPKTQLRAFGSQAETAPGHNEFVGTGGSLYYLRNTDILPGSDHVVLEVRDPTTGRVENRIELRRGTDYEIDELQGRLLLTRPLAQVTRDNIATLTRDAPLDGYEQRLVVDYEWRPSGFDNNDMTAGLRGKQWIGDHLGVGLTYVDEKRAGQDYSLAAGDVTLQAGKGTYLKAEYAQTESFGTPVFFSDNGGFSFVQRNDTQTHREGQARSLEGRINFKELGWSEQDWSAGAWWRNVTEGYSIGRYDTGRPVTEYGADVRGQFSPTLGMYARYSRAESGTDTLTQAQGRVEWRIDDFNTLSGEVRRVQEGVAGYDVTGLLGALKYTHRFGNALDLFALAQVTLDDDGGRYAANDLYAVGGKYLLGDTASVGGEVSSGDRGNAATVNAEYKLNPNHVLYGAYTYSTDTTQYQSLFNPSRQNGWTMGQRWRLSSQVNLFNESQFLKEPDQSGLAHTFGLDFYPVQGWNVGFTLQSGELENALSGEVDRRAVSVHGGRTSQNTNWQSKLEWRRDTGAERRDQWVSTNRLTHRINDSWRIAARLNYSETKDELDPIAGAKFVEGNVGFAYRPWNSERWGLFGRYTYLYDLSTLGQTGGAQVDQKTQILSFEGVYKRNQHWEYAAKVARREGEVRMARGAGEWLDSATTFAAIQARYELRTQWHALAEYRWLDVKNGGSKQGFLVGLDRDLNEHFRIGAGYNFTDFSDDLTNFDYDHRGWFLNLVGTY
ncbi:outer membrane beta-barrel domain protein [Lysobacter capsici]|nr:outer membrane beta-barrel domain protein [Lysobacter capsici]